MGVAEAAKAFAEILDPREDTEDREAKLEEETEEVETEEQSEDETEAEEESDAEDESEDESESEEEESEDEAKEEPRAYTVKVDGKEEKVSLDELLKGYSRDADYRRKTMQLAGERKSLSEELNAVREERQAYKQSLAVLQSQLEMAAVKEPDWAALRQQDPVQFLLAQQEWNARKERIAEFEKQRQLIEQQQDVDEKAHLEATLQDEAARLVDAVPEWRDAKRAKQEKQEIVEFATSTLGFTAEEMAEVYDHRAVIALRDAMRYRQMMAKREKLKPQIAAKSKPLKAGGGQSKPAQKSGFKSARERLARTGSVRDAASAFEYFLEE
jgi:hypothetical protein